MIGDVHIVGAVDIPAVDWSSLLHGWGRSDAIAAAAAAISLLAAIFTAAQARADRAIARIEIERWLKENEPDIGLGDCYLREELEIPFVIKNNTAYPMRCRVELVHPKCNEIRGPGFRGWRGLYCASHFFLGRIAPFSYSKPVVFSTRGVIPAGSWSPFPAADTIDFQFIVYVWTRGHRWALAKKYPLFAHPDGTWKERQGRAEAERQLADQSAGSGAPQSGRRGPPAINVHQQHEALDDD